MPDLISVLSKWWKMIAGLTALATVVALVAALVSPEKYLSTVTALPANSVTSDKARIFNYNIESLYSVFGDDDELDKIESAAALDTIFIATVKELDLEKHFNIESPEESVFHALWRLRKNSKISKSDHGELKIKVWDEDRHKAATIANTLFEKLQNLLQHLQGENNMNTLQKIREAYTSSQTELRALVDSSARSTGAETEILNAKRTALAGQLQQFQTLSAQYDLATKTNPPVLLAVEKARPSIKPDKPRIAETVLFTFFIAFVVFFLLALLLESRRP